MIMMMMMKLHVFTFNCQFHIGICRGRAIAWSLLWDFHYMYSPVQQYDLNNLPLWSKRWIPHCLLPLLAGGYQNAAWTVDLIKRYFYLASHFMILIYWLLSYINNALARARFAVGFNPDSGFRTAPISPYKLALLHSPSSSDPSTVFWQIKPWYWPR